jgi:4-aminobutyrate aminotransferase-like enzyme
MTVGGLGEVKHGYGPLVPDVLHAPFPYPYRCEMTSSDPTHDCAVHCLLALERTIQSEMSGQLAAIVFEPYQGAGGSILAPLAFVRGIRRICDETGAVMIVDEVQSSFGRTGTMFAFEQWDVVPDIVVVAKGIGSGVPTSAVVARRDLLETMPHGSLSSTYGGNPLSCAAALATLDVIRDERLPEQAARLGQLAMQALNEMAEDAALIGDVRGMGLAIGVELVRNRRTKEPAVAESQSVVRNAIDHGLVLIPPVGIHGNVLRVSPPLTIREDELRRGLDILRGALLDASNDMAAQA